MCRCVRLTVGLGGADPLQIATLFLRCWRYRWRLGRRGRSGRRIRIPSVAEVEPLSILLARDRAKLANLDDGAFHRDLIRTGFPTHVPETPTSVFWIQRKNCARSLGANDPDSKPRYLLGTIHSLRLRRVLKWQSPRPGDKKMIRVWRGVLFRRQRLDGDSHGCLRRLPDRRRSSDRT